ncbi:unnamed protein product [Commensalibacter communis]|uniref:hypothetical protein n=1 Tax=Commensalibacter communis TaxID=2972786 RepID=UPI0022FFBD55|nr:hypothetical protein [Commensalibacter communis]CAI3940144.1 unnamed protein product [Commensalibacter communis]CAI3941435.1 unnamed protein product [Commensalibacter communis]
MPDKMYLPSTTSSETEIIGQQDVSSTAVQVTSSPSRNADLESRSGTKGQRRDPFDFNQGCRVKLLMLKKNCSWHFQMIDNHTENILFEHNDLQETVMVSSK